MRATRRACTLLGVVLAAAAQVVLPEGENGSGPAAEGPFTQGQCLDCHGEQNPALVAQWRAGPHAAAADCVACHGERHGALPSARADSACTGCHDGAVAHSYATSKHGVLVRIGKPDWSLPLSRGNHRAPGCAYCHLHEADHGDTMDVTRSPPVRPWVCGACHAPRYVREQLEAGERLADIARLKVAEAQGIATRHPAGTDALAGLLESAAQHLRNVRLGAGHQSPDYQWWHGQPALDGDLIRLRGAVAQALRERAAVGQDEGETGPDQPAAAGKPRGP
ncbi:MAG: multiheme c-type cytochrome [Chromatiaceae bacterium]